jgi:hypothetical protein
MATALQANMKFLTKQNLQDLPPLYSQEHVEDPLVPVKFFNPTGAGSWFATEYNPAEGLFFGYTTGLGHDELGYFSLAELTSYRGPGGLGIERDLHWNPKTKLSDVKSGKVR